jgi:hypothetical protein
MTYPLLELSELVWGKSIGFTNDGNDVDSRRQSSHEFNVHFSEAGCQLSIKTSQLDSRVTGGLDKVE